MRAIIALGLLLAPAVAVAQDAAPFRPFSPISGPNNAIPSPVCDLINFGFCPQPPAPAFPVADPVAVAAPAPIAAPPPIEARRPHHRRHRATPAG